MGERTAWEGTKIKKSLLNPGLTPNREIQDSLLGFGAVGVINHHSPCKSSSHGLGCDELQLGKAAGTKLISSHPPGKPKRPQGGAHLTGHSQDGLSSC